MLGAVNDEVSRGRNYANGNFNYHYLYFGGRAKPRAEARPLDYTRAAGRVIFTGSLRGVYSRGTMADRGDLFYNALLMPCCLFSDLMNISFKQREPNAIDFHG